ncbi:MAG TPA: protein kinase [Chloroflexota bacterium]|nr:protein kinase [Chloroflexota bacterium]
MHRQQIINGRYHIPHLPTALIGQGAMGSVYLGRDQQTGDPVAIKHLKPELLAANPRQLDRFAREGELLRQLNHPNIVKVLAAVAEAGQHYIIMEYVQGGSLRDLLDQQPQLPIPRVLSIAIDVADALTRTHRLNIIHRDLKPANVLLAHDGSPRLTDFGLAFLEDGANLTQSGALVGTLDYIPPEACQGKALDRRMDIWAFGVMLFEMLAGQRPFTGSNLYATITAILSTPTPDLFRFRADVNDALADLVYRMLQKDPQQRIPSVRLVGAELEAIMQGSDIRPAATVALLREQIVLPDKPRFETSTSDKTAVHRHNLPAQTMPCIGREAELATLAEFVSDPQKRLISIVGSGGMGKTRLALALAEQQIGRFSYGVYFVPLAAADTRADIVNAIAEAVEFHFYTGGNPEQQLLDFLREKELLLVLDGLEHLQSSAGILTDILQAAPAVTLILTSRERLRLREEQVVTLAEWEFPSHAAPQTALLSAPAQLFVQSAQRLQPNFELDEHDLPALAAICHAVGGAPLGLILAATWVEMLTIAEIATEISASLDFLETDMRDVPERHRSLRAVFDSSWNLLNGSERDVFMKLSVFQGGFSRQAAQEITGASLRDLMALSNRSLLHRDPNGRYHTQRLLQQYAAEQLSQSPDAHFLVHDQHAATYAAMLAEHNQQMKGSEQQAALAEMEQEQDNLRAAWEWAIGQGQTDLLHQMVDALCRFYDWRGRYQEGDQFCGTAVHQLARALDGESVRLWAKLLGWQGKFNLLLGRTEVAGQVIDQGLNLLAGSSLAWADHRAETAFLLRRQAQFFLMSGDRERARQAGAKSLELLETAGDEWGIAYTLDMLGQIAWNVGAYGEAQPLYERSLAIRQSLNDRRGMADSLRALGLVALFQGRIPDTARLMQESNTIRKEIGDVAGTAVGLADMSTAFMVAGNFPEAIKLLDESLALYTQLGYRQAMAHWYTLLALACLSNGELEKARRHAERGRTLSREVSYKRGVALSNWVLGCLSVAAGNETGARTLFTQSVTLFREINQQDELAWALAELSKVELALGNPAAAQAQVLESLQIGARLKAFLPLSFALPATAVLLAWQSRQTDAPDVRQQLQEQAVELYALAARYPSVSKSAYLDGITGAHIRQMTADLPADVRQAVQERGQKGDLFTAVPALIEQLDQTRP